MLYLSEDLQSLQQSAFAVRFQKLAFCYQKSLSDFLWGYIFGVAPQKIVIDVFGVLAEPLIAYVVCIYFFVKLCSFLCRKRNNTKSQTLCLFAQTKVSRNLIFFGAVALILSQRTAHLSRCVSFKRLQKTERE